MADKIQILIEAILQKTTKENLETELKRIESQLKPIKVDVDIKDANKEIQKFAQTFHQVEGTSEKLIKETEQYKNSLGQVVKEVRNIKEVYDEQGRAQNVVSSTIKTITTDYEKQRKELEKLNAEQSKYWSQRVKETVEDMTRKPDELIKMADYYKQLEKEQQLLEKLNAEQSKYWSQRVKETVEDMTRKPDELVKMAEYYKQLEKESAALAEMDKKREQAELDYWSKRRKEAVESMTQINDELLKMREYYSALEKESAKENVRIFNLGTNLTDKTSGFTGVDRESVARYAQEIYGANAEITKFNQTMDKNGKILADATVRVNKNAKEYTEYKLKIDETTKSVNQFGEAVNRKTGKDMGIIEQFRVAMERFPVWIVASTVFMQFIHQIQDGISYISELDNSLNEIRIVTNKTQQEVNNLALSYNKLAKEMNVTTKEVASTAADLFRQGLDEGQVEERMRAIIQYAKISSISLDESNKIITATANATGESVQKIIDVFSLLGDITSSGAEEIGEALQKVASTAENSGVSLEKAASWIKFSPLSQQWLSEKLAFIGKKPIGRSIPRIRLVLI